MVGPYLDGLWKIDGVFSMRCLTVKKKTQKVQKVVTHWLILLTFL